MDFLPVNTSQQQRLQYTQSYILPQDINVSQVPSYFSGQNHINRHASSQHHQSGMLPQSTAKKISCKIDQSMVKAHQEIDDYIKRRSHYINEDHFDEVETPSNYSKPLSNGGIHEKQPAILESMVKNINSNDSGRDRKGVPFMVATNDNMELPAIKQSDLDRLDSSNAIELLGEDRESRGYSTVLPLQRRLQQSSVNINLQSQVRSYAPPVEQSQSLLVLEGVTQSLNNEIKAKQLPRNLQRYIIRPIAQHQMENIGDVKVKQSNQPRQQIIIIPQILSNSGHRASSKQQLARRNIIPIMPQSPANHDLILQQFPSEKNMHPIQISDQINEVFKGKDSVSLKRNLQQPHKISNSPQQIIIDPEYSGQYQLNSNGIPLERSFIIEKREHESIIIEAENHQQLLINSALIKQRRDLQQKKLDQSIPIQLEHFLNQDMKKPVLKSSLKRQIQHPVSPLPIQLQIQQQNQSISNGSLRSSLRRHLDHHEAEVPVLIEIEPQNHYINSNKLRGSIRRQLEAPSQPSMPVQIAPQDHYFVAQNMSNSIKRQLNVQAPSPSVPVQIPFEDEHFINQNVKSSIRRQLQHQPINQSLYVQIPLQNEHILHESLKSSLRRSLQAQAPPSLVYVQIPSEDEHLINSRLRSSLGRRLQHQALSPPISVQIAVQNQHILQEGLKSSLRRQLQSKASSPQYIHIPIQKDHTIQESLKSSLKRKLQPQDQSPSIMVQIPQQNQHLLQQSLKSSLRRKVQSQPQPPPIYIQIPVLDYHILQQSLRNSLRRKLEAHAPLPPVDIFIDQDNDYFIQQASKSPLKRNFQPVQQPQPIHVRLQQNEHSLYQSARSTLKRRMVPPSHEEAINVDLGPLKEHSLQDNLKNPLQRKLEPLPHEKLFRNEVQPSIQVELNQTNQQSLQQKAKTSLRRKLDASVMHRQIQDPINHNEILQDLKDPSNDSIHLSDLSEREQTIQTPKNIYTQRRDLRLNQLPQPQPQLPRNISEGSQQAIGSSSNRIMEKPIQMKKSVHLSYAPCEQDVMNKALLLSKRSLKAESQMDRSQKSCQEGWNPTKNVFNLFRIPATTKNTSQISFKKNRINTATLLH